MKIDNKYLDIDFNAIEWTEKPKNKLEKEFRIWFICLSVLEKKYYFEQRKKHKEKENKLL